MTYRVSTDGGAGRAATAYAVGGSIVGTRPDFEVDSARGVACVALRVSGTGPAPGSGTWMPRFASAGTPSPLDVHVGRGDLDAGRRSATAGRGWASPRSRCCHGRFAVAYDDTTTRVGNEIRPWLAILQ